MHGYVANTDFDWWQYLASQPDPLDVLSFHTYSDLVLVPYGYTNLMTPDSSSFFEWGQDFAADNHYAVGNAPRLLYPVNGDVDDFLYGETAEKPRAWCQTIEIGNAEDDFWPPPSRILPLAVGARGHFWAAVTLFSAGFLYFAEKTCKRRCDTYCEYISQPFSRLMSICVCFPFFIMSFANFFISTSISLFKAGLGRDSQLHL